MPLTVTVAQFRADLPVFASTTTYPDSGVTFWLTLADIMLNGTTSGPRWGTLLTFGEELFTAHNLVLEAMNMKAVVTGGIPGINRGVISSEAVGEVSLSYDTNVGIVEGAGHWNLTNYGIRFIQLARMAGAGGVQVGICSGVSGVSSLGGGGWGSGWGSGFGSGFGF